MKTIKHRRDYRVARAAGYPPVTDQIDALWKAVQALNAGEPLPPEVTETMNAIRRTKETIPKPRGK
jgi:hypothetical protein